VQHDVSLRPLRSLFVAAERFELREEAACLQLLTGWGRRENCNFQLMDVASQRGYAVKSSTCSNPGNWRGLVRSCRRRDETDGTMLAGW
jgi:hypothetical protein